MYVPAHFAAEDDAVRELLLHHGAADLITPTADGLLATLLPFIHDVEAGERVVVDGILITSRGAGTALDFGLSLIEKLFTAEKSHEIGRSVCA